MHYNFNINLLRDKNVVINCRTQEDSDKFISFLDNLRGAKSVINQWWINEEFTCYKIDKNNNLKCCDISFYKKRRFKILSFDEVLIKEINENK